MTYGIKFKKSSLKELECLERKTQQKIISAIESLTLCPTPHGSLKLTAPVPLWRIRVGSYRVLYEINNDVLIIHVIKIVHRKDAYRGI